MENRRGARIGAACGIGGALLLIAYFAAPALVGWPFSGESPEKLISYALEHQSVFYLGAWLQSTGTLLCVAFFLTIIGIAEAANRITAMLAVVASASLLSVVLVESAFTVAVPIAASAHDAPTVAVAFAMSNGVFVRIFALAPSSATYVALGLVLRGSGVLPRGFSVACLLIGVAFEVAGFAAIFSDAALLFLAALGALQTLWILSAATVIWIGRGPLQGSSSFGDAAAWFAP